MRHRTSIYAAVASLLPGAALAADGAGAPIDAGHHFQRAVTPVMRDIVWLDSFLHLLMAAIVVFVVVLMGICVFRFGRKRNPNPSTTTHNTLIEVVWTAVPVLILIVIAIPSVKLLFTQLDVPEPDVTIKATGNQWNWYYEYPDEEIEFYANMIGAPGTLVPEELEGTFGDSGPLLNYTLNNDTRRILEHYGHEEDKFLLAADNKIVVPVDANVHMLVTASDVIHAWTIPSFGSKIDAIPGRINETWFRAEEVGTYYGQCSELCGIAHSYMPIVVEVVSQEDYDTWVLETQAAQNGDAPVQTARIAD